MMPLDLSMSAFTESPIPEELLRNGREIDTYFDPTEKLYVWFQFSDGDRVNPASLRCPDQSCNREKYCAQPEWVLLPNNQDKGIGVFEVQDIPSSLPEFQEGAKKDENAKLRDFKVEHDPLDMNYSHSEIRAYKLPDFIRDSKCTNTVKTQFKHQLSVKIKIIKQPVDWLPL